MNASVDLFLQFRIEDPAEFIFTVGGVKGFSDKLENAISEVTRALIYEQRAEDIYDLVGESTQKFLDSLNEQFLPAVRFTNANITHAEPSSQEYRMDLAAPEMVRVAKEAYTYEYELRLRKEQDEGELRGELASLRETLSAISAEIATYQAQIDTARERETNRANASARERMVEAESDGERQRGAAGGPGAGYQGRQQRGGAGDPGVPLPAGRSGEARRCRRQAAAGGPDRGRRRRRRGRLPADLAAYDRDRRRAPVHARGHAGHQGQDGGDSGPHQRARPRAREPLRRPGDASRRGTATRLPKTRTQTGSRRSGSP